MAVAAATSSPSAGCCSLEVLRNLLNIFEWADLNSFMSSSVIVVCWVGVGGKYVSVGCSQSHENYGPERWPSFRRNEAGGGETEVGRELSKQVSFFMVFWSGTDARIGQLTTCCRCCYVVWKNGAEANRATRAPHTKANVCRRRRSDSDVDQLEGCLVIAAMMMGLIERALAPGGNRLSLAEIPAHNELESEWAGTRTLNSAPATSGLKWPTELAIWIRRAEREREREREIKRAKPSSAEMRMMNGRLLHLSSSSTLGRPPPLSAGKLIRSLPSSRAPLLRRNMAAANGTLVAP